MHWYQPWLLSNQSIQPVMAKVPDFRGEVPSDKKLVGILAIPHPLAITVYNKSYVSTETKANLKNNNEYEKKL